MARICLAGRYWTLRRVEGWPQTFDTEVRKCLLPPWARGSGRGALCRRQSTEMPAAVALVWRVTVIQSQSSDWMDRRVHCWVDYFFLPVSWCVFLFSDEEQVLRVLRRESRWISMPCRRWFGEGLRRENSQEEVRRPDPEPQAAFGEGTPGGISAGSRAARAHNLSVCDTSMKIGRDIKFDVLFQKKKLATMKNQYGDQISRWPPRPPFDLKYLIKKA